MSNLPPLFKKKKKRWKIHKNLPLARNKQKNWDWQALLCPINSGENWDTVSPPRRAVTWWWKPITNATTTIMKSTKPKWVSGQGLDMKAQGVNSHQGDSWRILIVIKEETIKEWTDSLDSGTCPCGIYRQDNFWSSSPEWNLICYWATVGDFVSHWWKVFASEWQMPSLEGEGSDMAEVLGPPSSHRDPPGLSQWCPSRQER